MRGVIGILALALRGCATAEMPDQWTKPGARPGDLAVDLYVCGQWSRGGASPAEIHQPYLNDCMTAHGWQQIATVPSGP